MTTPIGDPGAVGSGAGVTAIPGAYGGNATGSNTLISQPAFDARISTLSFPVTGNIGGPLSHGYMVWAQSGTGSSVAGGTTTGLPAGKAQVDFLYNPSTVEIDNALATSLGVTGSQLFMYGGDNANLVMPLMQTAEWSIMFDRTYELWGQYGAEGAFLGGDVGGTASAAQYGVFVDIQAMMQFTGMLANNASTGSSGTVSGAAPPAQTYSGIMQMIPCYVFFGDTAALSLYGYINEWDVTVTHWTQYMIPMRCVIDISFTCLPLGSGGTAAGGTAGVGGGGAPPAPISTAANYPQLTTGVAGR